MILTLVRFLLPPTPDDTTIIGWTLFLGGLAIMCVGAFG